MANAEFGPRAGKFVESDNCAIDSRGAEDCSGKLFEDAYTDSNMNGGAKNACDIMAGDKIRYLVFDRVFEDLTNGRFGDDQDRAALTREFQRQAALDNGRGVCGLGELALLEQLNNCLADVKPGYHIRFSQDVINIPGGRRLEIVDRSGRVTDSLDFVVSSG